MPNWCDNSLKIEGKKKTLNKILEFVKSEDSVFDFNKIVPMPVELKGTTCPAYTDEDKAKYKALKKKYGWGDWYEWALDNWGTKWSVDDVQIYKNDESIQISFATAWAPPIPVIAVLGRKFPDVSMTLHYREDGMQFEGTTTVKGKKVKDSCHDF